MTSQAIEDLNILLKNELSAVETYNQALAKFQDKRGIETLRRCQQSHNQRAGKLHTAIVKLGGKPTEDIGIGGKFGKLVMSGAQAIGDEAILVALETDEVEWSSNYEWRLVSMHSDYRPTVKDELWPQQQESEKQLRELARNATKGIWPATPGTSDI